MGLYTGERARRSIFHTAAFRAVSQVATIVGYIVMVRGMSEHDFGVLHLLYAVIPLISAGASLGLEHVLRRFQPEYLSQNRQNAANSLVSFVGRARFGTNLVVLGLIFASWHIITPLVKLQPYRYEFIVFSALILFFFQIRVLEISFSSHMLHKYSVGMQAAIALIKLIFYSTFTLLGSLSLQNALLSDTFAYGVAFSFLYVFHRRLTAPDSTETSEPISRDERKRMLRYGLFYNFNDAGTLTLNTKIDNFFIASIMNTVSVGVYSFYGRLADMVRHILPVNMFINIVRPMFFATPLDKSGERIPLYFTLLLNSSLIVQIPLTAFALTFHEEIVWTVFGGKFASYSSLLPMVMLFTTLNTIGAPVLLAAQYAEKAAIILISKVFGIFNIIALLALIPTLGVFGAALASGSAVFLKNLYIWWHVRHIARWKNYDSVLLATVGYWGPFLIISTLIKLFTEWTPLGTVVVGGLLWFTTALFFLRSSAISDSDREILARILRGRERRILRRLGLVR